MSKNEERNQEADSLSQLAGKRIETKVSVLSSWLCYTPSQNYRIIEVGKDLWRQWVRQRFFEVVDFTHRLYLNCRKCKDLPAPIPFCPIYLHLGLTSGWDLGVYYFHPHFPSPAVIDTGRSPENSTGWQDSGSSSVKWGKCNITKQQHLMCFPRI